MCIFSRIVRIRPFAGALALLATLLLIPTPGLAQTNYQRVHAFGPTPTLGSSPYGDLFEATDGLLYGTTYQGGSSNLGTIFKVSKDGTGLSVIRNFSGNFIYPSPGLAEGTNGAIYGTVRSVNPTNSGGIIYRVNKDGSGWSIIHELGRAPSDGEAPLAGLLRASDGIFYGTTAAGGASNLGTIFRINHSGTDYAVLHSFKGTNGNRPSAALIEGQDGWLYGTTRMGGLTNLGIVFKIRKSGADHTLLHEFLGQLQGDGSEPVAALIQSANGVLYGTTLQGGLNNFGTIYKLNTNGLGYQVIHHCENSLGIQPVSQVIQGSGGALFGTFSLGGPSGNGLAFRLNTDGTGFTVLRAFTGLDGDGMQPYSPLLLGSDGAFYGSTFLGGGYSTNGANGTIFKLFASAPQVRITSIEPAPTEVKLTFIGGGADLIYSVQASTNLLPGSWQTIGSAAARIDGSFDFSDPAGSASPARFYRSSRP
jgi:uncharacterized repeat protein (TIGR03803 family)